MRISLSSSEVFGRAGDAVTWMPASVADNAAGARWAFAMFIALVALLGLFLLVVVALMILRRSPRRDVKTPPKQSDEGDSPDPWTESARRMESKKDV